MATRAYLSTVFGCPYEQNVPVEQVIRLSDTLLEMGVDEISLGDTIGAANPLQVIAVLEALLPRIPASKIALHFHDTRGTALRISFPLLIWASHPLILPQAGLAAARTPLDQQATLPQKMSFICSNKWGLIPGRT